MTRRAYREPLRRCPSCGHLAYRFAPCWVCAVFDAFRTRGGWQ